MNIGIIGTTGQLGWELCRRAKPRGFNIVAFDLPEFDITNQAFVIKTVNQIGVSLIVNASAYTAVDQAESESEQAFAVNRDGPAFLASACAGLGIPLVHVSTDYVFNGTKNSPYIETDPVSPLGIYGKSKVAGENKIRNILEEHIILRTAWLYGVHGNNFVKTMLRMGKKQEQLRVVSDQYGCPTYAGDLADAVLSIAAQIHDKPNRKWGTYHFCGKGASSWHGFAEKIFELAGQYIPLKVKNVTAITTKDYPTPAPRPANSVLDCSLLQTRFNISPRPWQESLKEMIHQLFSLGNDV